MELRFKAGEYASQQGYANGLKLFDINWSTERGGGLVVRSTLPGIPQRQMPSTSYGEAREACRQLMTDWLTKVVGIDEFVIATYVGD